GYERRQGRPDQRTNETVRVRHVIKIERTRRRDSRNDSHLFDPKQDKRCPKKIEQLHRNKQNPQGDFVLLTRGRERDAVMSNEHRSSSLVDLITLSILSLSRHQNNPRKIWQNV